MEFALPHTILYQNADHSDDNDQWNKQTYLITEFVSNGLITPTSEVKLIPDTFADGSDKVKVEKVAIDKLLKLDDRPKITCEDAFIYSIRNRMFSMGSVITASYDYQNNEFNVEYPKGFAPNYIHLIGKRDNDWLTLLVSMDGEMNYGDLAYIPHNILTFALKHGHYSLSANSPIITPFLAKGPEESSTDWDQLLNN